MAPEGGESVADVASRFAAVLSSTETEFHEYMFLLTDSVLIFCFHGL